MNIIDTRGATKFNKFEILPEISSKNNTTTKVESVTKKNIPQQLRQEELLTSSPPIKNRLGGAVKALGSIPQTSEEKPAPPIKNLLIGRGAFPKLADIIRETGV